jgi:hypothetical protein
MVVRGKGVNVNQFIENLNSLEPTEAEAASQALHEDELSVFSNTQFFDFDMGRSTNIAATVDDLLMQQEREVQAKRRRTEGLDETPNSYLFDPQHLQQFSLAGELAPANYTVPHSPSVSGYSTPALGPQGAGSSASAAAAAISSIHSSPSSHFPPGAVAGSSNRKRRSATQLVNLDVVDDGEQARVLAEEDKRRRNTAASARFRIKKKLREQEMERTQKELQDKVDQLETKIKQLQMENRWLKNLVVEKNEARDVTDLETLRSRILGKGEDFESTIQKGIAIENGVKSEFSA